MRAPAGRVWAVAAVGGVALVARLAYGAGFDSYDPLWSLIWGDQIAHGELPDLTAVPVAPTSHPLANLLGALASVFGQEGPSVLRGVAFVALGVLAWAGYRLGRSLFGVAVGLGFAFLLVTRGPIVASTLQALVDIPFLALVIWAVALEAERPRRGVPVLALLGAAGLLRPEAWLMSAAYAVYLCAGPPLRIDWRALAGAAAAPLLWALFDLAATGDPLHSLHGTRELAGLLDRPQGTGTALSSLPSYLEFVLPTALVWIGLAGVLTGLWLLYRPSLLPAAVLGLGLLSFVALGVAGLPLLFRYVYVPALMLALFAVVALLGWLQLPPSRERRVWSLAAIPVAVVFAALVVPPDLDELETVTTRAERVASDQRSMRAVIGRPSTRALLRRCTPIQVRTMLELPVVAYRLGVRPQAIAGARRRTARGSAVLRAAIPPPAPRFRRRAGNRDWVVYATCGRVAASTRASSFSSAP